MVTTGTTVEFDGPDHRLTGEVTTVLDDGTVEVEVDRGEYGSPDYYSVRAADVDIVG